MNSAPTPSTPHSEVAPRRSDASGVPRGTFESIRDEVPTGIGLGLRWAFIDEAHHAELPTALRFLEVSPENYMGRGGYVVARMESLVERRRLITHGLMMDLGGNTPLAPAYLRQLGDFLRRLGVRYHSDHLCFSGWDGRVLHDLLPLPRTRAGARRVADRIKRVQDGIGLPMAVENISSYLGLLPPPSEMSQSTARAIARSAASGHGETLARQDTDFLNEVVDLADCGVLLDVNNVFVNSTNFGFDPYEFLREVPLHRVVQLHVAGGERRAHLDRLLIDTHGADVSDEVAAMMAWVVERIGAVPVLYERDNQIPPFDVLLEQVEALDVIYQAALARHDAGTASQQERPSEPEVRDVRTLEGDAELDEESLFHDLSEWVARQDVDSVIGSILERAGGDEVEARALLSDGPHRPSVYRSLVRGGLADVVRQFLPRTRARMGERFDRDFDLWLEAVGPTSRILREVPMEFFAWAQPRWDAELGEAEWIVDLARHELLEFTVAASTGEPDGEQARGSELELEKGVRIHRTARLVDYHFAVHELDVALDARDLPRSRDVRLLAYRDARHDVRYLELSALAANLMHELLHGSTLRAAVALACERSGLALDAEALSRVSELLADLSGRSVVLGAA